MDTPDDHVPGYRLCGLVERSEEGRLHRAEAIGHPGRPLLVEIRDNALTAEDLERLHARTTAVRDLEHPGILPVLEIVALPTGVALVMPAAGGGSLADALVAAAGAGLRAVTVDALRARLGDALRHIHAQGLHHGAITAQRIRFDGRGAPLLLGVGTRDPAPEAAAATDAAAQDLRELTHLLDACRGPDPDDARPVTTATERHPGPSRSAPAGAQPPATRRRRPSGRPSDQASARQPPRRAPLLAALTVLILPLVLVTLAVTTGPTPSATGAAPPAPGEVSGSPRQPPPACAHLTPPPGGGALPLADLDGSGCGTPLRWDGTHLHLPTTADGARTLHLDAQPGDRLLFADLSCDGRDTPVLHRPATGELFVLDQLPAPGRQATASGSPTGVRHGHAAAWTDSDGCDHIEVLRTDTG